MSTRRAFLAGLAVTVGGPAWAEATDPSAPIHALDDALLQIMHAGAKTPFGERARLAAPAIEAAFDLPQILKISIGARWTDIPLPQQLELTEIFRRYTIASYVANFNGFSGEKFEVLPQTRAVGDDQVVETRIVPTTGDPTRIDYVMRRTGDVWKAVDVLLDGSISRVAVQRSDFRALVGKGDATKLIASLRTKTEALEAERKS
jgi:phospholipid transport system substrate-binding protein